MFYTFMSFHDQLPTLNPRSAFERSRKLQTLQNWRELHEVYKLRILSKIRASLLHYDKYKDRIISFLHPEQEDDIC